MARSIRTIKITVSKSRWIALGLLAAVAGCFLIAAVLPVLDKRAEYGTAIENSIFRLQRLNSQAAKKTYWQERLEQVKQQDRQENQFIFRETQALASADLQEHIGEIIKQANGELTSTQALPEEKEEKYFRIAVKVRMTGSSRTLRKVLYYCKTATPSLFVQSLNIRPIRLSQPALPGGGVAPVVEKLSIDFDVVGYMHLAQQ
jgi:general secretion pathway protein M